MKFFAKFYFNASLNKAFLIVFGGNNDSCFEMEMDIDG
jgi:hypothetical protein